MKQLSLILNIVLLVAVGILYYLHFSGGKKDNKIADTPVVSNTKTNIPQGAPLIAYVELDSLYGNIPAIKQAKIDVEAQQKNIQSDYERSINFLYQERETFSKRTNITQHDVDTFQAGFTKRQQDVESSKQERIEELSSRSARIMQETQNKLKAFLDEYNQQKKYTYIFATGTGLDYMFYKDSALNITQDVLKGLNSKTDSDNK